MGEAQNLDCVLHVAFKLKNNAKIKFVFLGDGRRKEQLIKQMKRQELFESVFFPGYFSRDSIPAFMQRADVLLVCLKNELIFNLTIPAKVQFYMAQGKPILGMLNNDGAELINEARCGITVPVNDDIALQTAIEQLYYMKKEELNNMGNNGKIYYDKYFTRKQRIEQLEGIFANNVEGKAGRTDIL
jgi:glycosyltransferase involved in cell wall biosynthesis